MDDVSIITDTGQAVYPTICQNNNNEVFPVMHTSTRSTDFILNNSINSHTENVPNSVVNFTWHIYEVSHLVIYRNSTEHIIEKILMEKDNLCYRITYRLRTEPYE